VNNDEVESTAKEMKELVLATRDVFDPRPQLKVLRPDIQRLVKRQIPPCKVCGSELKQVTTSDGTTGFRCDKCRKIYKPKTTKPNG
jgi:tRNA(Ile2) C34 agmatinyltransferase TiaS